MADLVKLKCKMNQHDLGLGTVLPWSCFTRNILVYDNTQSWCGEQRILDFATKELRASSKVHNFSDVVTTDLTDNAFICAHGNGTLDCK